jgi:hypothetical protein
VDCNATYSPDYRGPTERSFTPFGDPATATPVLQQLKAIAQMHPDALAIADGARLPGAHTDIFEAPAAALLIPAFEEHVRRAIADNSRAPSKASVRKYREPP